MAPTERAAAAASHTHTKINFYSQNDNEKEDTIMRAGMNEKKHLVVAHADGEKPLNCIHPPHWATTCVRPLSAMNLRHHSSSSIRSFFFPPKVNTLTNLLNNFLFFKKKKKKKWRNVLVGPCCHLSAALGTTLRVFGTEVETKNIFQKDRSGHW